MSASLRWACRAAASIGGAAVALLAAAAIAAAQTPPDTREALEALRFEPIDWEPPTPVQHEIDGVHVLLLENHALPLVSVYGRFRGGYGLFERDWYAVALGLPALLRYGGTAELAPDSVDEAMDYYALQTAFGTGGGSVSASVNTLTEHLATALDLWGGMLATPAFDREQIELWRERELESMRRRLDDPGSLAFTEFNRLMYGDHPVGWEMRPQDLEPARLTPDRFRDVHRRIVCRDNLTLGATGDVTWEVLEPLLARLVASIPPCAEELPRAPIPDIRREPGVFLIERDLEQAVIVMAHPTSVRMADDPTYYAATIGNSILGGGGFSSRLLARVRTEEGYAYSASSLWTTPRRHDGLVGAITRTRPENAVPAIDLILATMEELTEEPPTRAELRTAVDRVVNGFVFNFEEPGQIVSRTMLYLAEDMPEDWLERYLAGIQSVEPEDVQRVLADNLRPEDMSILVVGDPERVGRAALAELGPVTVLELD
ncbi:MAG TPA: pitrilysin family protein [Longimicrobiales bacterium]|nr:pitrilysin family protein [Longimicrobiales bacterium]